MAKVTIKLPDELRHRFETAMTEMDGIAETALKAGATELYSPAAQRLSTALSFPRYYPKRGTGELRSSFGTTPVMILKNGAYDIKVGFGEPRARQPSRRIGRNSKGGHYYVATNAMVGNILEHGHKGSRGGQTPAPWWQPALKEGRKAAEEAIRKTVEDRLDEIFNKE